MFVRKKDLEDTKEIVYHLNSKIYDTLRENDKKQNSKIFELEQEVWKLKNPFKFKIGDEVRCIDTLAHFEIKENRIYKVIDCQYNMKQESSSYNIYNYKQYILFDCEENKKFTITSLCINENSFELIIKNKKEKK